MADDKCVSPNIDVLGEMNRVTKLFNHIRMNAVERQIADAWNTMAKQAGLPSIRMMTIARSAHLATRIREVGLDGVLEAVAAVGNSSFCCGARGWRADFDFLLQPKSFVRLLEGTYADRQKPRETFRNGALELLMREAEEAGRGPIILDGVVASRDPGLPLLGYVGGGDD
jgi:hypothetical protein